VKVDTGEPLCRIGYEIQGEHVFEILVRRFESMQYLVVLLACLHWRALAILYRKMHRGICRARIIRGLAIVSIHFKTSTLVAL
jgi:hypothetical protein